jgi:hypothetical protein
MYWIQISVNLWQKCRWPFVSHKRRSNSWLAIRYSIITLTCDACSGSWQASRYVVSPLLKGCVCVYKTNCGTWTITIHLQQNKLRQFMGAYSDTVRYGTELNICICICTYTHTHIQIHTYTHTYVYIYMYTCIHIQSDVCVLYNNSSLFAFSCMCCWGWFERDF